MLEEAARRFPHETGGILLGYTEAASRQVVVRVSVGPGPRAIHRRTGFVPDHEYHERETARIYRASGRIWTYLGDWHTHPRGALSLSRADRRTLARIARSAEARAERPIMIVLAGGSVAPSSSTTMDGSAGGGWRAGAWQLLERPSQIDAALGLMEPVRAAVRLLAAS